MAVIINFIYVLRSFKYWSQYKFCRQKKNLTKKFKGLAGNM